MTFLPIVERELRVACRRSTTYLLRFFLALGVLVLWFFLLVMGRERARTFADNHSEIGVLWLEPRGSRVLAHSWNLEVAAAAPFVTLAPSDRNPKLARIP